MKLKKIRKSNLIKELSLNDCPKCHQKMERRKHKEILPFMLLQPYYYLEWDYCRPCGHIQHYENYKIYNMNDDFLEKEEEYNKEFFDKIK